MQVKKQLLIVMLLLVGSFIIIGCNNSSTATSKTDGDDSKKEKINVIVSILPQADFVQMIGGELVDVIVMLPPGASPDSYEPLPGDLKNVSKADLYIKIGHLPFEEAWMDRILAANEKLLVVDSSEGIEIIDHDPHTWLSPRLVKKQVETICQAFIQVDKNNQDYYLANLEKTKANLDSMDKKIQAKLSDLESNTFLVYHPAWGYFARDYGLKEMAIEEHGKEPGPAEMAHIIATAKKNGIKTVFASPQHSIRSAEAIAAELGARVVTIDPLPSNYDDILNSAGLISKALGDNNE
ncbi:MAG TPA: zinc ABC transporter substrate-binding protein [Syntrophomonadaceae bacterium]|nr:zinc ABC transporter substrate-binding protein [Syntrophomonadaceae bacterium]